jgi:hypothetical protein
MARQPGLEIPPMWLTLAERFWDLISFLATKRQDAGRRRTQLGPLTGDVESGPSIYNPKDQAGTGRPQHLEFHCWRGPRNWFLGHTTRHITSEQPLDETAADRPR